MSLRDIGPLSEIYFLPEDDLVNDVIIPALEQSNQYRCMTAFFSSRSLQDLAPGLATYLTTGSNELELLASPYLQADDREAMQEGLRRPENIVQAIGEQLLSSPAIAEYALVRHTLKCLSYLLAVDRLSVKIVLVADGLFHPKAKIFSDERDSVATHGSNNFTQAGLTRNIEQVTVSASWRGEGDRSVIEKINSKFEQLWHGHNIGGYSVIPLPDALKERMVEVYAPKSPPTPEDFWKAYREKGGGEQIRSGQAGGEKGKGFHLPEHIEYRQGDYRHQGQAVDAWEASNRRGILEMATGSGKTITALVAAERLARRKNGLLILVGAPYLPLIDQWAGVVEEFGLEPLSVSDYSGREAKYGAFQRLIRELNLGLKDVGCVIGTDYFATDAETGRHLARCKKEVLLIADEVHNFGSERAVGGLPEEAGSRLGLSATPVRQYDEAGTEEMFGYFGGVVYEYGLEEAIGQCLVPYDYYVHSVHLTDSETDNWVALTDQLAEVGWMFKEDVGDEEQTTRALHIARKRRIIVEQASAKVESLETVLRKKAEEGIDHSLVYASDKNDEQLKAVNKLLLEELGLRIHQVTYHETGRPNLTRRLMSAFQDGDIEVLTAMRVLDEGVDLPEVHSAYMLASTTVERQWIQRRGRVLRKAPGKEKAEIHDWIALPPEGGRRKNFERGLRKLVKPELERVMAFARTATNARASDGPVVKVQRLLDRYFLEG